MLSLDILPTTRVLRRPVPAWTLANTLESNARAKGVPLLWGMPEDLTRAHGLELVHGSRSEILTVTTAAGNLAGAMALIPWRDVHLCGKMPPTVQVVRVPRNPSDGMAQPRCRGGGGWVLPVSFSLACTPGVISRWWSSAAAVRVLRASLRTIHWGMLHVRLALDDEAGFHQVGKLIGRLAGVCQRGDATCLSISEFLAREQSRMSTRPAISILRGRAA